MLPSGYLIRPCDGGGSIIHIVDHLNLEVRFCKVLLTFVMNLFCMVAAIHFIYFSGMECPWDFASTLWIVESCGTENDYCSEFNPSLSFNTAYRFICLSGLKYLCSITLPIAYCHRRRTMISCFTFFSVKALRYARQLAQETSGEVVYGLGRQPAVLRTFSQRLCRWCLFLIFCYVALRWWKFMHFWDANSEVHIQVPY